MELPKDITERCKLLESLDLIVLNQVGTSIVCTVNHSGVSVWVDESYKTFGDVLDELVKKIAKDAFHRGKEACQNEIKEVLGIN